MIVYRSNWRFICLLCLLANASCWLVEKGGLDSIFASLLSSLGMINIILVTNAMILDMISGFGEMISITVVTNTKIQDSINDFTENLLVKIVKLVGRSCWSYSLCNVCCPPSLLEPNEVMPPPLFVVSIYLSLLNHLYQTVSVSVVSLDKYFVSIVDKFVCLVFTAMVTVSLTYFFSSYFA